MRHMRISPVKIVSTILFCVLTSYAVPTNAKSAIADASAAGQFLCLVFYETKDASFTAMSSSIETFIKTSTKNILVYNAKVGDPANQEVQDRYFVTKGDLPMLLVIAPNGAITGGSPKTVTADQLTQFTAFSDLMLKVVKPLQEQKVVLVALQNASTRFNTDSWAGVNAFANDTNYKKFVAAVKADPTATGSQDFIKQCQLIPPILQATVVVLIPPGKIAKVLTGKTTKDDILKSLQACKAGSGCCSDRRYKQNITPIASALEKVSKLQGVTFTWNRKDYPSRFFCDGPQIGLIAQDVETVIPEAVLTDNEGFKSVAYDKLTAVLVEAVKEMKIKMNSQDSIIKVQSAQIKALEAKR
jgi:hypothetical protein